MKKLEQIKQTCIEMLDELDDLQKKIEKKNAAGRSGSDCFSLSMCYNRDERMETWDEEKRQTDSKEEKRKNKNKYRYRRLYFR